MHRKCQKDLEGEFLLPYKSERMKLPENLDRRRKLTNEQKEIIKHKYATGSYSLQKLANEYMVSKKTILLIVNPESKRKNDQHIKDHWREYNCTGEERNKIMTEFRHRKQQLYLEGKLKENNTT